jgi:hypothetical protein
MLQQPPMPPPRRSEKDQNRGRKRSRCSTPAGCSVLGPLLLSRMRRWAVLQCLLVVLLRSSPPYANAFSPLHNIVLDNRHSTLDSGRQGRGIEEGANRKTSSTFSLSSQRKSNGPTTGRLLLAASASSFDGSNNNSMDEWSSRRRNQGGAGKKRRQGYRKWRNAIGSSGRPMTFAIAVPTILLVQRTIWPWASGTRS